jgi:hypothetical protein
MVGIPHDFCKAPTSHGNKLAGDCGYRKRKAQSELPVPVPEEPKPNFEDYTDLVVLEGEEEAVQKAFEKLVKKVFNTLAFEPKTEEYGARRIGIPDKDGSLARLYQNLCKSGME